GSGHPPPPYHRCRRPLSHTPVTASEPYRRHEDIGTGGLRPGGAGRSQSSSRSVNGCLKPWGDVRHVSLPSHLSEETRGDINTSHHGRIQQMFEIYEEMVARFDEATKVQDQER